MLSDLSDEEIEVTTGAKLPTKSVEFVKRKNELRALEQHVRNIIFNLGGEALEDSEETNILLRRRSLRLLMEEKAARTRAGPRWSEHRRAAIRRTIAKSTESRRVAPRQIEPKNIKLRQVVRAYQSQLTQVQSVESVRVEQVEHQWTDFQRVEQEFPIAELQQDIPQWIGYIQLPSQAEQVILTPVENVQPQVTEIKEVTEVRVVEKIRIYEEITER